MNHLSRLFGFLVLFFFHRFTSFSQNNVHIIMVFQETVCPPSWISYEDDEKTFQNLRTLFETDSIRLFDVRFTGKALGITCEGCSCLTGRNIEVTILQKDRSKLEIMKFHKPRTWMEKKELVCDWTMNLNEEEIQKKLLKKNIHSQGVYSFGSSEKTSNDCLTASGRSLSIQVDNDDINRALKEGFTIVKDFKEY